MARRISAGKPLTISSTVRVLRPPSANIARHITGFGRALNLAVRVPSGDDGPGGGERGRRNSSMPATELSRPTVRTSVPRILPPPLKGLERSRHSATFTSCRSAGDDLHGIQELHCGGDWRTNCSGRSSRGTQTATVRSYSQASNCSRSSPGFQVSSGHPIGCSLKPSNATLSTKPLVAPKSGPQCNASASFAAPPARQRTGRSWSSPHSESHSVSEFQRPSQQRRMDRSSTSRARRAAEDSTTQKWDYGRGTGATSWRNSGPSRGTTLTAPPSSLASCSYRPTSQRFSRQRSAAVAQFAGTAGDVSGRRNCKRWACRCTSSSSGAAGTARPLPVSMPQPHLAGPSSKGPPAYARLERQRRCALVGRNPGHVPLSFLTLDPWGLAPGAAQLRTSSALGYSTGHKEKASRVIQGQCTSHLIFLPTFAALYICLASCLPAVPWFITPCSTSRSRFWG